MVVLVDESGSAAWAKRHKLSRHKNNQVKRRMADGAGVNWRELAQSGANLGDEVLVKIMDGVEVRTKAGLFRTPVPLS